MIEVWMNLELIQIFYNSCLFFEVRSSKPPVNQRTRERDQLSSKSRETREREREWDSWDNGGP